MACILVTAAQLIRPPVHTLLPPFPAEAFGASWSYFWNVNATSTIVLVAFVLAGGVMGDLIGRRRVLLFGAGCYLAGTALAALAQSVPWYLAAAVVAGIGASLAIPLCVAMIRLSFAAAELPYAFAAYTVFTGVASLGAAVLPGPLRELFGWRAMFAPALILGSLGLALALRYLPESQTRGSYQPLDAIGIAAWSAVILAIVFGLIQVRLANLSSVTGWSSLGVAAMGTLIIIYWEWRSPGPILRQPPFPRTVLSVIIVAGLMISFALLGYALQVFSFLQQSKRYGPVLAGFALTPLVLGLLGGSLQAARRMRRVPARALIALGLGLMVLAMLLTAATALLWRDQAPYPPIGLLLALFGGGYAMAATAWQTLYMSSIPPNLAGLSAGISGAAGQLGGVVAGTLFGVYLVYFGGLDFTARLTAMGLEPAQVAQARELLNQALQPEALADPAQAESLITSALLATYRESYATAFGAVLLVGAALLSLCVILIWFSLRPTRRRSAQPTPTAAN